MKAKKINVKKTNARFAAMTPAQKRMAIARDAMKQIEAKKYVIKRNRYLDLPQVGGYAGLADALFNQETLKTVQCRVCQVGACLASAIRLFNKIQTKCIGSESREITRLLSEWFEQDQLALMEVAFEGYGANLIRFENTTEEEKERAVKYNENYADEEKRSLAIFRNIIKNRGAFKP